MGEPAEDFLRVFRQAVATKDISLLREVIAEDASFHSPAFYAPKEGRDMLLLVLHSVVEILEDMNYVKEWVDGQELILEFEASVDGKKLKGIDRIHLNEDGQVIRFEVLMRPLNGLMAVAEAMGKKMQQAGAL